MTSYASLSDGRAYGIGSEKADDTTLTAYLELASRVVDNFTGRAFGTSAAATVVTDARNARVVLPTPFASVTAVSVNGGAALAASAYREEPWGLLFLSDFYRDSDGFPVPSVRTDRSVRVAVTATFGYATLPSPIRQATLALCDHFLARSDYRVVPTVDAEGNPTALPTAAMTSRAAVIAAGQDPEPLDTTGLIDADRLLYPFRRAMVG